MYRIEIYSDMKMTLQELLSAVVFSYAYASENKSSGMRADYSIKDGSLLLNMTADNGLEKEILIPREIT